MKPSSMPASRKKKRLRQINNVGACAMKIKVKTTPKPRNRLVAAGKHRLQQWLAGRLKPDD